MHDTSAAPAAAAAPAPPLVSCPHCGRATDSLKRLRLLQLGLFAWVFWYVRTVGVLACPRCMRRRLLATALLNTVPMNVLWPFAAPLAYGLPFLFTFRRGHSRAVRKALGA